MGTKLRKFQSFGLALTVALALSLPEATLAQRASEPGVKVGNMSIVRLLPPYLVPSFGLSLAHTIFIGRLSKIFREKYSG